MYYYFISCSSGTIYATLISSYQSAFGSSPVIGNVYRLLNITDLPDDCYTRTTASETFIEFTGYIPTSQTTIAESGCADDICSIAPSPSPTPTPASIIYAQVCGVPGIYYQIVGYTGSATVGQAFYLDFSDYTNCYQVVSRPEVYTVLNIAGGSTTDYDNCTACINANYPSSTPTQTPTSTPDSTTIFRSSPTPTKTPTQTPTPTVGQLYVVMSACCRNFTFLIKYGSEQTVNIGSTYNISVPNGDNSYFYGCATAISGDASDEDYSADITTFGNSGLSYDDCVKCQLDTDCCVSGYVGTSIVSYTDCCGVQHTSVSRIPETYVCLDTSYPFSGIYVSYGITQNCEEPCITPTPTPQITPTPTVTPTNAPTQTPTTTARVTVTPTKTPTQTPNSTPTNTPTTTARVTNTPTGTPTPTPTPSISVSSTPSVTPTPTPSSSFSGTLADKLESCETTTQSQKVYVFYDGTSLDENSALAASESIRSWYQTKVNNGELLSGNLYEGIIGENNNNGENWLWWASYPYLGSLTGGTLATEFNSAVTNSEYDFDYCKSNVGGECVPKNTEFNDEYQVSSAYRRINRGYELTGTYGIDDPRSNGVPFDHNDLDFSSTSGPGTFTGGEINYVVIIVADEADGVVGLYHGRQNQDQLYTNPFELLGPGWKTGYEYTDRFKHDYESYLKVWEEIKNSGGTINGLIYPVIDSSIARIPFVQHTVASIEGETISSSAFLNKYGQNITSVGPVSLNLSALTYTNVYSGLTTTAAYQNLDSQYQNGAGLKNFGFYVDPTVTNFTETVVSSSLNNFLIDIETPLSTIYLTPDGKSRNQVYNIDGDCYTVVEVNIETSEPITTPTTQTGPFTDCEICETTGCFSGITDGFYTFTDCCGDLQQGTEVGLEVCVDTAFPYQGIAISPNSCIQDCDGGPLDYTFEVTGTCENPGGGVIQINPLYGVKPYTITNTVPGSLTTQTGNGPFIWTNVSEGSYTFLLQDSSGGVNQSISINVNVEGCFTAEISASGTTCGDIKTGLAEVIASSNSLPYTIDLYNDGGLVETVTATTQSYLFDDLTSGNYYAIVTDFGGATAQTNTDIVVSSTTLDYGLIVTDDSRCRPGFGSAVVTGLTGTAPYTYLWSNGETGSSVTNLTQGTWSVTITDSEGCFKTTDFTVGLSDIFGVVSTTSTNVNCLQCDGTMTVTISGGTSPYNYLGSNGQSSTTNNQSFTLTGLCANSYSVIVTDAGSCQVTATGIVNSNGGINSVSINTVNSQCNNNGSMTININASPGLFTYTITDNVGVTQTITTTNQTHTFNNLPSGTYTVTVSDGSDCVYTTEKVIENTQKFDAILSLTGTTCNQNNAILNIQLSAGTQSLQYPFDYVLTNLDTTQVVYQSIDTGQDNITLSNLSPATYQLDVNDKENCTVTKIITISASTGVNFTLTKTDCVLGNDGTASVTIYEGIPPFTYLWSNGETTSTINGLSGGTYSVTITDSNGCELTKSISVNCDSQRVDCYEIYNICEDEFTTTVGDKRGFEQMLNEAFIDLTSGDTNCVLNEVVFYVNITLSGGTISPAVVISEPFYTGTTLNDYPSDEEWLDAVNTVLSSIPEIGSYTLDLNNNQLIIYSDCDGEDDPLRGAYFKLSSKLVLDIDCDIPLTPTPTPSVTPTQTPTPSNTPASSPTPTPTSTQPHNTSVITLTNTVTSCAKGSISVIKNGTTTLYSYSHGGALSDYESTSFTVNIGDNITIYVNADVPTGAACAGIAFYTDIMVDVDSVNEINITSIDNDSHSFIASSNSHDIDIIMSVS